MKNYFKTNYGRSKKIGGVIAIILFLSLSITSNLIAETIETWTYHRFPPFIINEETKEGLTYDLIDRLNKKAKGEYKFALIYTPRNRLNGYIKNGRKGILVWAVSLTFGGIENGKYDWTSHIIHDKQDFISLKSKPVNYTGKASSLFPYKLGGVMGHTYFGIQEETDQGKIKRVDVRREEQNITKLIKKRVDFISMSNTGARYYVKKFGIQDKVHFSKLSLNTYDRNILMQNGMSPLLYRFLNRFVQSLPADKEWQKKLDKYGLK